MKFLESLIFLFLLQYTEGKGWTYNGANDGPEHWAKEYVNCGGKRQSPIDIYSIFVTANESLADLALTGYDNTTAMSLKVKNNGHTVQVDILDGEVYMENGGLPGKYNALQFHFHWGSDDKKGSEHRMMGKAYPLEMHIVHFADVYGNVSVAIEESDGLAALGVFFEVGEEDNPALTPLIDRFVNVSKKGQNVPVEGIKLSDLMPQNHTEFYRYLGSLTTPKCQESVIWTLFSKPMKISSAQLEKFRELSEGEPNSSNFAKIKDNWRPVQKLNGRSVQSSFVLPKGQWGYMEGSDGPLHWGKNFDKCAGQKQSPINIVTSQVEYDENFGDVTFSNWNQNNVKLNMRNNGHTAVIDVDGDLSINGGGLPGTYKLAQFHFHWGSEDWRGSEHTVDGDAFPLELHAVHYSDQYYNLKEAAVQPEGLAVIGVLFEVSETDNARITPLLEKLANVMYKDKNHKFSSFQITNALPETMKYFYRYSGSLTTPGCYESVLWTVFHEKAKISKAQLDKFRKIYEKNEDDISKMNGTTNSPDKVDKSNPSYYYLKDNYRPIQHKFGRVVKSNKKVESGGQVTQSGVCDSGNVNTMTLIPVLMIALVGYVFS